MYKAHNKEIISKNNKKIEEGQLQFWCSKDVVISPNVYICSGAKICSGVKIETSAYIGQNVILLKNVKVPQSILVSATSSNKIHNKTAEEVEKYFKD